MVAGFEALSILHKQALRKGSPKLIETVWHMKKRFVIILSWSWRGLCCNTIIWGPTMHIPILNPTNPNLWSLLPNWCFTKPPRSFIGWLDIQIWESIEGGLCWHSEYEHSNGHFPVPVDTAERSLYRRLGVRRHRCSNGWIDVQYLDRASDCIPAWYFENALLPLGSSSPTWLWASVPSTDECLEFCGPIS